MLNVLRKPTESDNLGAGISSMSFLGGDVKTPPRSTTMALSPEGVSIPQVPSVMSGGTVPLEQGPPTVLSGNQERLPTAGSNVPSVLKDDSEVWKRPSVLPRNMGEGKDVQSKMKGWDLEGTPIYGVVRGGKVTQFGVDSGSPLAIPDNILFGGMGNNVTKAARNWALINTPIFQAVQSNPNMQRSNITNKIGRVAKRNGTVLGATRLRIF